MVFEAVGGKVYSEIINKLTVFKVYNHRPCSRYANSIWQKTSEIASEWLHLKIQADEAHGAGGV